MNPWSANMVHQLTESEMMDYVRYLHLHAIVELEKDVDRMVDHVVERWKEMRIGSRVPHPPIRQAWISQASPASPASPAFASYHAVDVRVFPWMDEDVVRYVAREQILEQVQNDAG